MERFRQLAILGLGMLFGRRLLAGTAAGPVRAGSMARQMVAERASVVLVTSEEKSSGWQGGRFLRKASSGDADGGSAAPISPDGYFLTADHVLSRMEGKNVFVFYTRAGV